MTRCKNVSRHLSIKNSLLRMNMSLLEVLEDFLPVATTEGFNTYYGKI